MDAAAQKVEASAMEPRSYECSRCGMAVPAEVARCPSCRTKRRRGSVVASAEFKTGPQAAAAWEAREWQSRERAAEQLRARAALPGDAHAARAVAPGAVLAASALRVVVLAAVVAAAVQATRLLFVATIADPVELAEAAGWDTATRIADVVLAITAAATMVAAVLAIGWAAVAEQNVRALALDTRRWGPSIRRVAVQVGTAALLAAAWGWAPGSPDRTDRVIELVLAFSAVVALGIAAATAMRVLLAVTARELQQEELLLRIEAASVDRPRGHTSLL